MPTLEQKIEKYIKANKVAAKSAVAAIHKDKELVMYGETHVKLAQKAEFFADIVTAKITRYHASEHFLNVVSVGKAVDKYLKGKLAKSALPAAIRSLAKILDAMKPMLSTFGLVFSGSRAYSGRDYRIYANFKSSRALHLKAGRFGRNSKGAFHIGAAHAARYPLFGSAKTTTRLLINAKFDVGVVRLVVDAVGSTSGSDTVINIVAGESIEVEPVGGGRIIDLLPILRRLAGGKGNAFGVDLRLKGSPFSKVKPQGSTSSRPYNQYFDMIIFLP